LDDLMHPSQKLIMPTSVRVARIIMSVQLAGAVFLFAILVIPMVLGGVFIPEALLVIVLIVGNGVAIGVVVFGMKSRRPWVRWMGVTIQALGVVVFVLVAVIEADFSAPLGLVLSVAVIVLLLTRSSAAWFDASPQALD